MLRITQKQLNNIIKESIKSVLKENEYTQDVFAANQNELAYQNGEKGNYTEDATFIIFNDGTKFEVDTDHDDIKDIRIDLKKNGYTEGKDYRIVTKPITRYWSA